MSHQLNCVACSDMGKKSDLTEFQRGMIVGARCVGTSISKTAALVKCSRAAVVNVYKEWTIKQKTGSQRQTCGRHRVLNARSERRLARVVQRNRRATVRQIASHLNQGATVNVSERTVRRTLRRIGYGSRRPVRKPLLSALNKRRRLQFAKEHKHWTVDDWKRVMWSDESRFQMHRADGRMRIWRKQHESMDPNCIATTLQAGGGNVMVWGMFSWYCMGPLIPVPQRLNAQGYLSIIADQVHPFMSMVYSGGDGYFQQDNAPCHKAGIVLRWFEEHDGEFNLLRWPAQSPDLNPIENLWDEIERALRQMDPVPSNLQELASAVQRAWSGIPSTTYQHLIESMPRRIKAVIRAKGGPTAY